MAVILPDMSASVWFGSLSHCSTHACAKFNAASSVRALPLPILLVSFTFVESLGVCTASFATKCEKGCQIVYFRTSEKAKRSQLPFFSPLRTFFFCLWFVFECNSGGSSFVCVIWASVVRTKFPGRLSISTFFRSRGRVVVMWCDTIGNWNSFASVATAKSASCCDKWSVFVGVGDVILREDDKVEHIRWVEEWHDRQSGGLGLSGKRMFSQIWQHTTKNAQSAGRFGASHVHFYTTIVDWWVASWFGIKLEG